MRYFTKPALSIFFAIALVIFGFIFLVRGCLAKYDERFAHVPTLYFEQNNKGVVFAIVEHQKTTSYSQNAGSTSRSVSTSFYIQVNDASTAALLKEEKIKSYSQVKNFPVEVLGPSGNNGWIFMGELMAFDAFSLEKTADTKILEVKNPSLAGKFPADRSYYYFNRSDKNVYFTAIDGSKWKLDTKTLLASPSDYNKDDSPLKQQISALEVLEKKNEDVSDSLYQQKNVAASNRYSAKEISYAEYNKLVSAFYAERDQLYKERDSLAAVKRKLETKERSTHDIERSIETLEKGSPSYTHIKTNQDTMNGKWYGLYGDAEFKDMYERVEYRSENDETTRRKLLTGSYAVSKNDEYLIAKDKVTAVSSNSFLHAGFLLDKFTAMPVHLAAPGIFLIVHKEQIGREGKILLSRITDKGSVLWTFNTQLTDWVDWICNGRQVIVFGTDNKNLSSNECNVLWSIDLETGKAVKYDYFTNKQ